MATKEKNKIPGFALLEIAIALCILGLINYASFGIYNKFKGWQNTKNTKIHQEQVMQAVAAYTLVNNKLPCPATSTNGQSLDVCDTQETSSGYVPYKTLGISEETAKDSQNHWLTYAIESSLTSDKILEINKSSDLTAPSRTFCGIDSNSTLQIMDENNHNCILAPNDFAAVLLISHGKSGGYYLDNGETAKCSSTDVAKIHNANKQGSYFIKNYKINGSDIFDDILIFASRNNFMSQWAKNPCTKTH